MPTYGERLKDLRARAGYRSVKEAAEASGINKETLHAFEANKTRAMQPRTRAKFYKLAELYGVDPSEVLPDTDEDIPPMGMPPDQWALVEDAIKAVTPEEDQARVIAAARRGRLSPATRRHLTDVMTDGQELLRIIGPTGMGLVWRMAGMVDRHRAHRDAMLTDIGAAFDRIEAKYTTPNNHHHTQKQRA